MKIIILVLLYLFSENKTVETKSPGCLQLDIVIVGDLSGSVQGSEKFVSDAFQAFSSKLEVSEEAVKIGVVVFNSVAYMIQPLTSDKTILGKKVGSIASFEASGSTNMLSAFGMAIDDLVQNGRKGFRKIIIMVSDGAVDNSDATLLVAQQIKAANISICGVLILDGTVDHEFMKVISSEYCYTEANYGNLIKELEKLDMCF